MSIKDWIPRATSASIRCPEFNAATNNLCPGVAGSFGKDFTGDFIPTVSGSTLVVVDFFDVNGAPVETDGVFEANFQ